ncbi:AIPR family protein [Butyrivibrio sp. AE2032]|uniref:AIPR family protein n=1 Tax=Butyrivibrio sp. AE2032 TaxID=1458463 RepID=UPI000556A97C|nr:AIPR family protein [Butyrivibrio sp. AE2032]
MNIDEFRKEFIDELRVDASINQTDTEDAFIEKSLGILVNYNEIQDLTQYYYIKQRSNRSYMEIYGYGYDEADSSLILLISDFKDDYNPTNLGKSQIDQLYKRMINFLQEVYFGDITNYCDDSDEIINIAKDIRKKTGENIYSSSILKYKFIIITNAKLSGTVKRLNQEDFNDRPAELSIWTIERYYEALNSERSEVVYIDTNTFNVDGIPFLKEETPETLDYDAYLTIVPGKFLADIYIKYGSRLLEGNVRAFLSAKGKVNSGIRNSIIQEPTKFFTYNNGIAATANSIAVDEKAKRITGIDNLQIINGGQTTASLANAVIRKDNVELSGIYVAMKLTVIKTGRDTEEKEEIYNQLVERISKCANCQNPVKEADFFSNSPFHVAMERISKKCIAPPVNGSPYSTLWYYERSRGKYDQEQFKMKPSEKEKFKNKYPKNQKITKEDLAKYVTVLDCQPHLVVYGASKMMSSFGEKIEKEYETHREIFNEHYYQRVVCGAIIYKSTDRLVNIQPWYPKGGNKAQIVPYTISKIISLIPSGFTLDFNRIWKNQSLYPSFVRQIEIVSKIAHEFLLDSNGIIVRDYARDSKTWERFKAIKMKLTDEFISDLYSEDLEKEIEKSARKDQKETNMIMAEVAVAELGSPYWRNLISQAKQKGLLSAKDESILMSATKMDASYPKYPTSSQAKNIMQIRARLGNEGIII